MISAQRLPGQTRVLLTRDDGMTIMLSEDEAQAVADVMGSGPRASRCADDHLAEHRKIGEKYFVDAQVHDGANWPGTGATGVIGVRG